MSPRNTGGRGSMDSSWRNTWQRNSATTLGHIVCNPVAPLDAAEEVAVYWTPTQNIQWFSWLPVHEIARSGFLVATFSREMEGGYWSIILNAVPPLTQPVPMLDTWSQVQPRDNRVGWSHRGLFHRGVNGVRKALDLLTLTCWVLYSSN